MLLLRLLSLAFLLHLALLVLLAFLARLHYLVLLSLLYHLEPLADLASQLRPERPALLEDPPGQSHLALPEDRLHRLTLEDMARQLLLERLVLP